MRELHQNWKDIFLGFKIAKDPWKVILGICLLIVLIVGIKVNEYICGPVGAVEGVRTGYPQIAIFLMAIILGVGMTVQMLRKEGQSGKSKMIAIVTEWVILLALAGLFAGSKKHLTPLIRPLVNGIWAFLVFGLFGGAIVRSAAVELATDDRISIGEAFRFAVKKYFSFLFAPFMPVIVILFFAGCILLAQAIINLPIFGFIASIVLVPLMIISGFIIIVVTIGLIFGFVLMYPTIGAEGSDSFDAISRAYSYVFMKPWKFIWYNGVVLFYAMAITLFLSLFAGYSVKAVADFSQAVGKLDSAKQIWPTVYSDVNKSLETVTPPVRFVFHEIDKLDCTGYFRRASDMVLSVSKLPSEKIVEIEPKNGLTRYVVSFFVHLYVAVYLAIVVSLLLTLNTITYFLLRKDVDGNDLTEVYLEEEEQEEPLKEALSSAEEKIEEAPPKEEPEEGRKSGGEAPPE